MTKTAMTLVSLLLSAAAFAGEAAQPTIKERVIKDETNPSTLKINSETARCSDLGYGNLQLKLSAPDLAWMTIFNHANPGESVPCITAGACRGVLQPDSGHTPAEIIIPGEPEAETQIRVVLKEVYEIDEAAGTCTRDLIENVSATVRGLEFTHARSANLGEYPIALCKLL